MCLHVSTGPTEPRPEDRIEGGQLGEIGTPMHAMTTKRMQSMRNLGTRDGGAKSCWQPQLGGSRQTFDPFFGRWRVRAGPPEQAAVPHKSDQLSTALDGSGTTPSEMVLGNHSSPSFESS